MSFSTTPSTDIATSSPSSFPVGNARDVESEGFVDRRGSRGRTGGGERRQFGSSHTGLTEDGRELALAIDQYKVQHHRRYITCDEMLEVLGRLGYSKNA
tara:strand:- start:218237 stop:218533 length:297 start_codon:yes stop_codon:yes gene_type:complete